MSHRTLEEGDITSSQSWEEIWIVIFWGLFFIKNSSESGGWDGVKPFSGEQLTGINPRGL